MLTKLHHVLLELYETPEDVERLIAQVGLDMANVKQAERVSNLWWNALAEVSKHGKVKQIASIAEQEYGEHSARIQEAVAHYSTLSDALRVRKSTKAVSDALAAPTKKPTTRRRSLPDKQKSNEPHDTERALLIFPSSDQSEALRPYVTTLMNVWVGEIYLLDGEVRRTDAIHAASHAYDWLIYIGDSAAEGWPLADGFLGLEQVVTCVQSANVHSVLLSTSLGGMFGLEVHKSTETNVLFAIETEETSEVLQALIVFVQKYHAGGMAEAVEFVRTRGNHRAPVYFLSSLGAMNKDMERVLAEYRERIDTVESSIKRGGHVIRFHMIGIVIAALALTIGNLISMWGK